MLFAQHRAWWLADDEGPWVSSGLQDPTDRSGSFLGQTLELRARWGIVENIFLQAGYVYFAFGAYPQQVPGGPTANASDYEYFFTAFMF